MERLRAVEIYGPEQVGCREVDTKKAPLWPWMHDEYDLLNVALVFRDTPGAQGFLKMDVPTTFRMKVMADRQRMFAAFT